MSDRSIKMTYRNYRDAVGQRAIVPICVTFGATEWHPEPQWLLTAKDCDKKAVRDFALSDCDFRRAPITTQDAMTVLRRAILAALDEVSVPGWYLGLRGLSSRTDLPRETLRGLIADMRAAGWISHHIGLWTEDGGPGGAVYAITDAGRAALRTMEGGA
mgnify:CR=1 FL=1